MNLRQLEVFLAVVESGGYVKAAEHLHVSHSAIYRHVRMLEDEIHDCVLMRDKHLKLTDTGRLIVDLLNASTRILPAPAARSAN
jgi:DNA-binding transcriptional LysR family regulator